MPYTINLTNGDVLVSVPDSQINTNATPIRLVGKNYIGYGEIFNENLVQMLEHFSSSTSPISPLQGQLWWNSDAKTLNVWTGIAWKPMSVNIESATAPTGNQIGDQWWDSANRQLNVWHGTGWTIVGPASPAGFGETGLVPISVLDTNLTPASHIVVKVMVNNVMIGVISKDSAFPTNELVGVPVVQPGFTLAAISPQPGFAGTASNALALSGLLPSSFLRTDQESATQHILRVQNNSGLFVGANNNLQVHVSAPNAFIKNNIQGNSTILQVTELGGTIHNALTLNSNGRALVAYGPSEDLGVATKKYVDDLLVGPASLALSRNGANTINGSIRPETTGQHDLGTSVHRFRDIYSGTFNGTATNSVALSGLISSQFLRSDIATTAAGVITITNNGGLVAGATAGGNIAVRYDVASSMASIDSLVNDQPMRFTVKNNAGTVLTGLTITNTGEATVIGNPSTALGIAPRQYVDAVSTNVTNNYLRRDGTSSITGVLVPSTTETLNLGSTSFKFNTVHALSFNGTATNSSALNNLTSSEFMRSNANTATSGTLTVNNNGGLTVGASTDARFVLSTATSNAYITANSGVNVSIRTAGGATTAMLISAADGRTTVVGDPIAALGIATKQYVDNFSPSTSSNALSRTGGNTIAGNITPDGNNTRNLGTSALRFNTIFATTFNGTATSAQYADLAERFEADAVYAPGTVVELGGTKEITAVVEDASESVFGVISDRAAYLMNAGAGSDETHPAVAMQGRVPVRVIGKVKKGERLVAAGNGVARAAQRSEWTSFNVIGRALQSKDYEAEGIVEVVVKLNA